MINIFDKLFPSYGGKVITDSKYIKDAVKNKNLEDVVKDIDNELARQQGEISALHSGNYITVTAEGGDTSVEDIMTREGITPAVDTIYRIGAWDGTQYDDTAYSEYSWNQDNGYKFIAAHKEKGIDTDPTADSHNLVESGGVQNELALGAVYDVSAKNPTSGPNNDGKWESLSALLSDANLNTLIPTSVRKGGMSIKFVQSSDNKYVQYRCTSDEFTIDTIQWAIADEGVYVENPEFVYVKTDAEGKLLWAIKNDGDFYFGAGVPQQVTDFINALLGTKVDKEENKSLIDAEYASSQSTFDSPEYIQVITDSEGKMLEGLRTNGEKVFGILPPQVEKAIYDYIHDYNKFPIDFGQPNVANSYLVVGDGNEGGRKPYCIAIGKRVLTNNIGIKNMTVGYDNMYNCSGHDNTSMGYHASFRQTSGNNNAAFGSESQDDNTTGSNNVSVGYCALQRNNTGSNNVAIGVQAIAGASYPSYDESNPKQFDYNIGIGASAMYQALTESEDNIAIGHASLPTAKKYTHCIAIGRYSDCDKDYQAVIGGSDTLETMVRGDFVVKGTDGIKRQIVFNQDGTCSWIEV